MARGVNKAIILGRLAADPEVRHTQGGSAIASFRLATDEEWKDKQTGEKQSRTEWHSITVFGKLAEICGEYLKKGAQVYIEGSLRTDKYTDKEGVERYTTKIVANEMQMVGSKTDDSKPAAKPATPAKAKPVQHDPFDDSSIPF